MNSIKSEDAANPNDPLLEQAVGLNMLSGEGLVVASPSPVDISGIDNVSEGTVSMRFGLSQNSPTPSRNGSRKAFEGILQRTPIRFGRDHPFSMNSPHAVDYEGKLYLSITHLWHAMRFLRRPAGWGRDHGEESWHPEIAEEIRLANEPELCADQWARAGSIGKDGWASLQRSDWEQVQMEKMDEVITLKFTQHPALGKMLMSTNPAQLLYMWDTPMGAGSNLEGPNNFGKAVMRCRDRLMAQG